MKKTILLVCLVPTVFVLAENFTIQKKKKKIPSKSTLQQHCCDAGAELIKEFAQILKQIGDMQLILADTMQAYFENNKKHVFMCATKEQLQQQKKTYIQYNVTLNSCKKVCEILFNLIVL